MTTAARCDGVEALEQVFAPPVAPYRGGVARSRDASSRTPYRAERLSGVLRSPRGAHELRRRTALRRAHGSGERLGSGPARVGADAQGLRAVLAGRDAVALDLPGLRGDARRPRRRGARPTTPRGRAPCSTSLGGPVVVLGHSFGGRVAVHLANLRPELVRGPGADRRAARARRRPPQAHGRVSRSLAGSHRRGLARRGADGGRCAASTARPTTARPPG